MDRTTGVSVAPPGARQEPAKADRINAEASKREAPSGDEISHSEKVKTP